ncbi:DUF3298 and DUF4163 domain-containing protein [Vallitalea okinawensis]|uniref:DUF3298 and DUF4163 domain-containing protein n=1 Tax=Vallitalea okinawensis TaxID=2078660 RepID=UPI000CFBC7ED|nr:DUF3298 and DUF4163 domain-containing protein [Vallitalea okinawensis]
MENKLKDARQYYKNIEIPEELNIMIDKTLNTDRKSNKGKRTLIAASITGALVLSTFTIGLNSSQVFAKTMSEVPVIGSIAKVLTFKDFEIHSDVVEGEVTIPEVDGLDSVSFEEKVNTEIQKKMDLVLEEAELRAQEYKEAYLETGGTEEDFRPVEIFIDYEVKHSSEELLSFVIVKGENLGSAYNETFYYNLDLKSNNTLTLVDFFGENYIDYINQEVIKQIEERTAKGEAFFEGDMGFQTIAENQNFYINEDGQVTVVFAKYEIAPGAMGQQEFIIE